MHHLLRFLFLLGLVCAPAAARAQGSPAPAGAQARITARTAAVADSLADQRWHGMVLGGVMGGAAAGLATAAFCEVGDCGRQTAEAGLVGAFIGAGLGGMIGSRMPKRRRLGRRDGEMGGGEVGGAAREAGRAGSKGVSAVAGAGRVGTGSSRPRPDLGGVQARLARRLAAADSVTHRQWTPIVAGAVMVGAFGAWMGYTWSGDTDSGGHTNRAVAALGFGALGAGVGSILGAFAGVLIDR